MGSPSASSGVRKASRWSALNKRSCNILGTSHSRPFSTSELTSFLRFKGNSTLVSTFEARRLSRAYLVLLENLLHKTPSARPSCERVASAIRDGKVSSSIRLSGSGYQRPITQLNPLATPLASRQPSHNGSPDALVPRPRSTPEQELRQRTPSPNSETSKFLSLPPPTQDDPPAPQPTGIRGWIASKRSAVLKSNIWRNVSRTMRSPKGRLSMRLARSAVLVAKVSHACLHVIDHFKLGTPL